MALTVRPDDEVYQFDTVWLGPDEYTLPIQARYVAWGTWLACFLIAAVVLIPLGGDGPAGVLGSLIWSLGLSVVLSRAVMLVVDHERPLRSLPALFSAEARAALAARRRSERALLVRPGKIRVRETPPKVLAMRERQRTRAVAKADRRKPAVSTELAVVEPVPAPEEPAWTPDLPVDEWYSEPAWSVTADEREDYEVAPVPAWSMPAGERYVAEPAPAEPEVREFVRAPDPEPTHAKHAAPELFSPVGATAATGQAAGRPMAAAPAASPAAGATAASARSATPAGRPTARAAAPAAASSGGATAASARSATPAGQAAAPGGRSTDPANRPEARSGRAEDAAARPVVAPVKAEHPGAVQGWTGNGAWPAPQARAAAHARAAADAQPPPRPATPRPEAHANPATHANPGGPANPTTQANSGAHAESGAPATPATRANSGAHADPAVRAKPEAAQAKAESEVGKRPSPFRADPHEPERPDAYRGPVTVNPDEGKHAKPRTGRDRDPDPHAALEARILLPARKDR